MKVNIIEKIVTDIDEDQINVVIETRERGKNEEEFIKHVKQFDKSYNKVTIVDENIVKTVECKDIIAFYGKNKSNYCRTKEKTYKIRSKLYELEDLNTCFVRISKKCIVNIDHIVEFMINEEGRIIVKLDDNTEEIVSRRKMGKISKFIKERRL